MQQAAPMTFSTMQKQGIPRPPSPQYSQPMNTPYNTNANPSKPTTNDDGVSTNNAPTSSGLNKYVPPVTRPTVPGSGPTPTSPPPPTGGGTPVGGMRPLPGGVQPIHDYNVPGAYPTATMPNGQLPPNSQPTPQPGTGQGWNQQGQELYNRWSNSPPPQQFQPGANPFMSGFNQQLGTQIMNGINNPSAYTAQMVGQTYDDLNRKLSQGYDNQRRDLQTQMARRGIDYSTIHGNNYSDLGAEQGYAQADLAHQLIGDQAKTYRSDMATALGQGLGYSNQLYGQDANTFGMNQNAQQQAFNQQQQNYNNYNDFGQQEFNNQMTTNQFNAQQQQQLDQLLLQLMGGIGG